MKRNPSFVLRLDGQRDDYRTAVRGVRPVDPSVAPAPIASSQPAVQRAAAALAPAWSGPAAPALGAPQRRAPRFVASLMRARLAAFGVVVLACVVAAALAAPLLAPHDPRAGDVIESKRPPMWMAGGSPAFPLGTDELGRDILSRVIYGSRISLVVGFTAVLIAGTIGVSIGRVAGVFP